MDVLIHKSDSRSTNLGTDTHVKVAPLVIVEVEIYCDFRSMLVS